MDLQPRSSLPRWSTIEAVGAGLAEAFTVVDHNAEIEALLWELSERLEPGSRTADEEYERSKQ